MVLIGLELLKSLLFLKGDVNLADADGLVRGATNRLNEVLIPPSGVYAVVNALLGWRLLPYLCGTKPLPHIIYAVQASLRLAVR